MSHAIASPAGPRDPVWWEFQNIIVGASNAPYLWLAARPASLSVLPRYWPAVAAAQAGAP